MNLKKSYTSSKIIGIQFSILSPDEIRKSSVAEITTRDTYVNNKPVIGGLFDTRMGVLEPGLICPTDGLTYMDSPGYSGHIELARPVFYIQYLSTVIKLLKCICYKCSKLLISKEKYKQALKLEGSNRWKYVQTVVSNVKSCGDAIENGCGCTKPYKIRKEGIATIFAEWKGESENIVIKMTPEMILTIFKRISDEDVEFMGFSPMFSRPEWMICQVLYVPPPSVRPSVKHDAQQRSEDDLSHILVSILKTNKYLQDKIQNNAPENIIDDMTTVLQYYVATQIDNKIPGVASVAQRSGRPLKSIKDRLNGKSGRMRGNLMAKRVDFSARSVITADPNISIRELGIPMKIAKNITKPVVVNARNKKFLTSLIRNGPDIWPGAKILEKENGESITLRYFTDRNSIVLQEGDTVHRHMMDGDPILFNRQPTLHRMSMMCHLAKIMKQGDTFRMNVADTKPYNADFDGDEMNLHMPQDIESETELRNLAAVPYHIISPGNNSSIVGIFQDSMLGCYQFTRDNIEFSPREAMNLLMMHNNVNENELLKNINENRNKKITSFDILSQIMPPLSMSYTKQGYENDETTPNLRMEIVNGKYKKGQINKEVVGGRTKGLIQRCSNDFGSLTSSKFIDDLQNIVTQYMASSSFSVGISDLISDKVTNDKIVEVIKERKKDVQNLIHEVQFGLFDNSTGETNERAFETQINNILNQATSESGKIGLKSLGNNNRFVTMVKAGSKGSDLNISFMISCLGQQNVDGKRIPYGFDSRTLPHYSKYDDSPVARGFVENSYINGLTPQELFFHAMGGRVGLIDTAVKTSTTGYIQRRLIKGLEDLMVNYDMTVRNNKNKVVQFQYGEDSFDTVRVENQPFKLTDMSIEEIFSHFMLAEDDKSSSGLLKKIYLKNVHTRHKTQIEKYKDTMKSYVEFMIDTKSEIISNIFNNKDDTFISMPISFYHIINNVQGQMNITSSSLVDVTLYEALQLIEDCYNNLQKNHYVNSNKLFKTLFFFHLSPKQLIIVKRFNLKALQLLLSTITYNYKRSFISPGEMVGVIAGQSIGEVSTQMTLNTFHFAGVASKSNVTRGVPRIEEILALTTDIKNPSLSIYLKPEDETQKDRANTIMYMLEHTKLEDIVKDIQICFDPDDMNTLIKEDEFMIQQYTEFENIISECVEYEEPQNEKSKWIIRMELNPEIMLDKNITMDDVNFTLNTCYQNQISCIYSDYNSDKLIFRIRIEDILKNKKELFKSNKSTLDQSDQIYILKNFQENMLKNIVLRGIKNIDKVTMRKIKNTLVKESGSFAKKDIWVLDTIGTNLLETLALDYIDVSRTVSNNIVEVYNVLGIEAARQTIFNELVDVIEFDGTYINYHHFSILIDRMTFTKKLISICRFGINSDNIGPIAKASFEETPEMFLSAARHGELDNMRGVSANVMCGQEGYYGTSSFQVVLDMNEMIKYEEESEYQYVDVEDEIEKFFDKNSEQSNDVCSMNNLSIQNNVVTISGKDTVYDDDYDPGF